MCKIVLKNKKALNFVQMKALVDTIKKQMFLK